MSPVGNSIQTGEHIHSRTAGETEPRHEPVGGQRVAEHLPHDPSESPGHHFGPACGKYQVAIVIQSEEGLIPASHCTSESCTDTHAIQRATEVHAAPGTGSPQSRRGSIRVPRPPTR